MTASITKACQAARSDEFRGRRELALEWFGQLAAPSKGLITYADAGHSVVSEEAAAFHRLMVDEIVPATYGEAPGDR